MKRSARQSLLLLCLAVLAASCADGYPTEDVLSEDPAAMTGAELLHQMNRLGNQAHLDRRWRYSLTSPCELEVSTKAAFGREENAVGSLMHAEVRSRFEKEDETFDVQLHPLPEGYPDPLAVLNGNWADQVQMKSLLQHLQRRCRTG